ncbi:MAG: ATP-dependent protease LonB [Candidatus ainarchaeum sp.]|nr:ATP-dependent protease LonB [Candidatus ainarchaeum sp.]
MAKKGRADGAKQPLKAKSTAEVEVPEKLIDWIIGQERAVRIIKKAAAQRRNVLLMGAPGTGKSMIAQAMAELMPREELEDILVYPNQNDENQPAIKVVRTFPDDLVAKYAKEGRPPEKWDGQGRVIIEGERMASRMRGKGISPILLLLVFAIGVMFVLSFTDYGSGNMSWIFAATILGLCVFGSAYMVASGISRRLPAGEGSEAKLIVDNSGKTTAPFIDATGARAGALFGDVRHDPLQSGGLGTPAHLRVESGAIHRANKGVLFVDEVSSLTPKSQQDLLTAMQDKRFSITGQSEMSSGALVKTQPVPCDFVLVAAGNLADMQNMHPALRSRIRGYGYEVYMEDSMPDTPENAGKIVQFIAQEVKKDGKIPHFSREAAELIVEEARRKSGRKGRLTLKLRELGGLVRAAGDVARENGDAVVTRDDVIEARDAAASLEQQISKQVIELRKDYRIFVTRGYRIGRVNGLAVLGGEASGLVLPIVAEVTPASSRSEGKLIATGKLGDIAKEAVENVSAIIKKHIGRDVSNYDMHVQFLQTYEGVEGDSASISIAVAVLSAMEGIPVDQSIAMTGSLSVRGEVLPVGGVTPKVEAAIDAGCKTVLIPRANEKDVYIDRKRLKKVKIVPVATLEEVLSSALKGTERKKKLVEDLAAQRKAEARAQ